MKQLLTILCVMGVFITHAQEQQKQETKEERQQRYIEEVNPFRELGYKPKISTLSKGKYREAFPDSIVQIGNFTYNILEKRISGVTLFEELGISEATAKPEIVSRWMSPDPLSDEFPSWSPYTFTNDNPIYFTDPTGLAPIPIDGMKFDFNDSQQFDRLDGGTALTSTVVNNKGEIIDHKDDGDDNIYLNSRDGKVIGKERADRSYDVGDYLTLDDVFGNAQLPNGFIMKFADKMPDVTMMEVSPLLGGYYKNSLKWIVYLARGSKGVKYVGITSQFAIRQATHLRTKGIFIEKILEGLSKADARAVEQVLIEMHKLGGKSGQTGQLLNKINSISKNNPGYGQALERGMEILKDIKF